MALLAIGAELVGDLVGLGAFTELGEAAAGFLEPFGLTVKDVVKTAAIGKTVYDAGRAVQTVVRNPGHGQHRHVTHDRSRHQRERRRRRTRGEAHPFHRYNPPRGTEPYDYPVGLPTVPRGIAGQGIYRPVAQLGESAIRYLTASGAFGQPHLDESAYPPDINQLLVGTARSALAAAGAATHIDGQPQTSIPISMGNSRRGQELHQHPHTDAVSQSLHNMAQSFITPLSVKV